MSKTKRAEATDKTKVEQSNPVADQENNIPEPFSDTSKYDKREEESQVFHAGEDEILKFSFHIIAVKAKGDTSVKVMQEQSMDNIGFAIDVMQQIFSHNEKLLTVYSLATLEFIYEISGKENLLDLVNDFIKSKEEEEKEEKEK